MSIGRLRQYGVNDHQSWRPYLDERYTRHLEDTRPSDLWSEDMEYYSQRLGLLWYGPGHQVGSGWTTGLALLGIMRENRRPKEYSPHPLSFISTEDDADWLDNKTPLRLMRRTRDSEWEIPTLDEMHMYEVTNESDKERGYEPGLVIGEWKITMRDWCALHQIPFKELVSEWDEKPVPFIRQYLHLEFEDGGPDEDFPLPFEGEISKETLEHMLNGRKAILSWEDMEIMTSR